MTWWKNHSLWLVNRWPKENATHYDLLTDDLKKIPLIMTCWQMSWRKHHSLWLVIRWAEENTTHYNLLTDDLKKTPFMMFYVLEMFGVKLSQCTVFQQKSYTFLHKWYTRISLRGCLISVIIRLSNRGI